MTKIFQKPEYKTLEVDRAGRFFAESKRPAKKYFKAIQIINNRRESHVLPLQKIRVLLHRYSHAIQNTPVPLITYRIKRLPSIRRKLRQEKTMRLSQMQDIGGCRVVMQDVAKVTDLVNRFKKSRIKHDLFTTKDYIHSPKPTGYRCVHLVYRFESVSFSQYNGLRIEIQIRTKLQHLWATCVETVDTMTKRALKYNQGPQDWQRFFALMSGIIAAEEGTPLVLGMPSSKTGLLKELLSLTRKLKVASSLSAFSLIVTETTKPKFLRSSTYFLLEIDPERKKISITGFKKTELGDAFKAYSRKELAQKGKSDIVLVSVNKISDLRKGYPNYYADTREFVNFLKKTLNVYDLP